MNLDTHSTAAAGALGAAAIGAAFLMMAAAAPAAAQSPCGPTTTVQAGDTYAAIAERCAVSVGALEQANPGVDPHSLQVGQTLQLTAEARPAEPMPQDRHRVEAGETVFSIAQAMGITVEALIEANPDLDPDALRIGQIVMPPGHGAPGDPADPGPGTQVSGVLTHEGVECQAMRGHDGELYTLIGDLEGHDAGDLVQVRGEVQEVSICQQGITIDVADIRGAG